MSSKAQTSSDTVGAYKAATAKSFRIPYEDPASIVLALRDLVKSFIREFYCKDSKYFSPYIVISQSSGYGKSRLVRELALHFPTVYFCFRAKLAPGFP